MKLTRSFFGRDGKAAVIGTRDGTQHVTFVVHGKNAARRVAAEHPFDAQDTRAILAETERSDLLETALAETEIVDGGLAIALGEAIAVMTQFKPDDEALIGEIDVPAETIIRLAFPSQGKQRGGILAYRDNRNESHVVAFLSQRQGRRHVNTEMVSWANPSAVEAIRTALAKSELVDRLSEPGTPRNNRREVHLVGSVASRICTGFLVRDALGTDKKR